MKDFIKWWLIHALHWVVLYGAFVAGAEGALYVLKFWVWVMAPASLFLLTDKSAAESAKRPRRPVRGALSLFQAWVTLSLLVWFGHIASALAWGLVMLALAAHRAAAKKAHTTATTSAA